MALLLGVVTFVAVSVIGIVSWIYFSAEDNQEVVRQRIEAVRKAEQQSVISVDLQLLRNELYSSVPLIHRVLLSLTWSGELNDYVAQAGMKTTLGKLLLMSAVCGLGGYVLMARFTGALLLALVVGLVTMFIPFGFVGIQRSRRLGKFEENFADSLDLLARAIRAGHAFTTGLEMVSKESPEPIASEFRKTFEEQNFGLPLRDALLNLAARVPLVDVRFFVTALLIQKETGGNLAEILDGLATVIRDRFRIHREVRVRTAQGRLTAMILVALPVVMIIVLELLNPKYIGILFSDPAGPMILGVATVMQIIGSLLLWKIVHIQV